MSERHITLVIKPTTIRSTLIFGMFLVVAAVAIDKLGGSRTTDFSRNQAAELTYEGIGIPELFPWNRPPANTNKSTPRIRNPFQFVAESIDLTTGASPELVLETKSTAAAVEAPVEKVVRSAAPRFDREYLGCLGPDRLLVAVFRQNGEIQIATSGHVFDGKFIVERVGPTSVDIGRVDHPRRKPTNVMVTPR